MTERQTLMMDLERILRDVFLQIRKELGELFGETLTSSEYMFLKHLSRNSPQTVTALSDEFNVSLSHVTSVSDRLVQKQLIERQRSDKDRRIVELNITENGVKLVKELELQKTEYFSQKFSKLTSEELEMLLTLFNKIK